MTTNLETYMEHPYENLVRAIVHYHNCNTNLVSEKRRKNRRFSFLQENIRKQCIDNAVSSIEPSRTIFVKLLLLRLQSNVDRCLMNTVNITRSARRRSWNNMWSPNPIVYGKFRTVLVNTPYHKSNGNFRMILWLAKSLTLGRSFPCILLCYLKKKKSRFHLLVFPIDV